MDDIKKYYSHEGKDLSVHLKSVVEGVMKKTNLKIAEFSALFHDLGKINPFFQQKLHSGQADGYSSHGYLSAFSFFLYCAKNKEYVLEQINNRYELLSAILAIIAHHHGDLPDFPIIFKKEEFDKLITFLEVNNNLKISDFLSRYFEHQKFEIRDFPHLNQARDIMNRFYREEKIISPLDFFLDVRFAFSSLILSDKIDASGYSKNNNDLSLFTSNYLINLNKYISSFTANSEINKLRTELRKESISNINLELKRGERVFSLTAPTGSGKTIMMLSLAGEILKTQSDLRIIYALPFLSIIEQTYDICCNIFKQNVDCIQRIDSKAEKKSEEDSGNDYNENFIKNIIFEKFAEDSFDYPFIITTFVRIFETFLSNKNNALLKFPNFSNSIFLIDEIQSIPPRLYGFFVALLQRFCFKFNSYAIISTATMPNFNLPENNSNHNLYSFFPDYKIPKELLSYKHFRNKLFNRYNIKTLKERIDIAELFELIKKEKQSVLVILNTIQDAKDLYKLFSGFSTHNVFLLNTNFTTSDRRKKIVICKNLLKEKEKVILISTQLIEAGVDIDFPIVYRDLCPLPNIIQSAGRCNRNNNLEKNGKVITFNLQKHNKSRSDLIYKGRDSIFLNSTKTLIPIKKTNESDFFKIQQKYFERIQQETIFGEHEGKQFEKGEIDFIEKIQSAKFQEIGKFKLIDEADFGEEYSYYIMKDNKDSAFDILMSSVEKLKNIKVSNFDARKLAQINLRNQIRAMSDRIVRIRIRQTDIKPPVSRICCDIHEIEKEYYSFEEGIKLNIDNQFI